MRIVSVGIIICAILIILMVWFLLNGRLLESGVACFMGYVVNELNGNFLEKH